MLEGCKITSQQTIFAVLQEKILILLSSANVLCIKNHRSVHPLHLQPIFLWFSEVVGISIEFMLDSPGCWKHVGGRGRLISAFSSS